MRKEESRQLYQMSSLAFDVEQDLRWRRKWFMRRIGNDAQREQWNAMFGAGARNKFRFHVHRGCVCRVRDFISLLTGIDQRGQRQQIGLMNWQAWKGLPLGKIKGRKISREQEITRVQLIIERTCKSSAD